MGKNLIQQKRGKGTPTYRAPSFRYYGDARYKPIKEGQVVKLKIVDLIHSSGHSAPLVELRSDNGLELLTVAVEGLRVGDYITFGYSDEIKQGNILPLSKIPEGTIISNIEANPGDGGKLVRAAGSFARVVMKMNDKVVVQLPSKKEKVFDGKCLATIGTIAGYGKAEKPFLKAGRRYYYMKARNKLYPRVHATSMNAVDHPFGGTSSAHKGKPTIAPKNAPPGRKVGKIRPKRVGRKKR
ncbi:50S ribosomal protein L2 [Candidatus Woesearchaeota archaeon ex4484_78]|nr:MAG: 50S ribosomal protein L2 [Candidatus Woesearchaeota archaeon ex4484_78]